MVEKNTQPPGFASVAQARTIDAGSGTCSSISMQVTTSKRLGHLGGERLGGDLAVVDVAACRPPARAAAPPSAAWRRGRCRARWRRAAPSIRRGCRRRSRRRARACPASGARPSIQSRRSGLIWCSGRNSLSGSHQRWASSLNLASSRGIGVDGAMLRSIREPHARAKTKSPAERGFSMQQREVERTSAAGADHFDFHATVLRAAFGGLVVGDGLLLALAFGVDAVLLDALADQVGLDGFGAADRQLLVVGVGADRVGVADGDDDFEVDAAHLADQVVELGLAFGLQHRLVEVEERVGREGDLLARRRAATTGGGRRRGGGGGRRSRRGRGAGAGAGGAGGSGTPSQPCRPVAGVQYAVAPAEFVGAVLPGQCRCRCTQLSTVCADDAGARKSARAAVAKSDATLFSFFMILLSREGADSVLQNVRTGIGKYWQPPRRGCSTTDRSHCAIGLSCDPILAPWDERSADSLLRWLLQPRAT